MRVVKRIADEQPEIPRFEIVDRRGYQRGVGNGELDRQQLVAMIVGTYREMPGLCLYLNQAARLFGLRAATCQVVLDDLVRVRQLRRTLDGQYTTL